MSTTGWIIFFVCLLVFSLVLYKFDKIKAYFTKIFKSKPKTKNKSTKLKNSAEKNSSSPKVKANEKQIRPILKPPEEKKEEKKEKTEDKAEKEMLVSEPVQKPLEYKLQSTNNKAKDAKELMKLKTDLDKEFEDIRKYLNLPEPINIKNVKKVPGVQNSSTAGQSSSLANGFKPQSSSNFVKGVGRAGSTANEGNFPFNSRSSFNSGNNKLDKIEVNVEADSTKLNFDANKMQSKPLPPYGNQNSATKKHIENKIVIDGDEIDLNKLPLNIKKLLISDILARKNYDD